ncbi:MAG: hypothetical protein Q7V01_09135 [Vicinamibacterales bacterium]|nr:hypothetical protein [Vicinamibacterales bacterium]
MATSRRRGAGGAFYRVLPGVLAAAIAAGCGKMGPPLAPFAPTPARIMDIAPRRQGDTVHVRVTVPDANLDGTRPVDLDRVDVYAFTGLTATDVRELKYATKIGTIKVQRHVPEDQLEEWEKKGLVPPPNPGIPAGGTSIVTDVLTPESFVPVTPREDKKKRELRPVEVKVVERPLAGPQPEVRPRRFYAAIGISRKKIKGPNSIRPSLSLELPPSAPRDPVLTFNETAVTLSWTPPVEQRDPIQEPFVEGVPAVPPASDAHGQGLARALARVWPSRAEGETAGQTASAAVSPAPAAVTLEAGARMMTPAVTRIWAKTIGEPRPVDDLTPRYILPATPKGVPETITYAYNVYLVSAEPVPLAPGAATAAAPESPVSASVPLNAELLTARTFDDPIVALGKERCYVVRAVDDGVESEPTPPVCVTPVDNFPPPAPTALAAIGSEGAVSLIWEGVEAADLAGYIVMRGEGADAPLEPLFEAPIRDTAYRDATAKSGVRYTYAVVSVDTAEPRNVSLPSNRVDEVAR